MATITLQDYYDNLEQLLSRNAYEEVIRHSRHIMQFYPKNANVFRFLGRALLESGETEEAGEIFRRLLGVYPDDFTAHVSLSKVYQKLNKPDEALWHLERAFEQDPNNQSLIDALRELYQRYRKVEQTKLQLTAAAVARQYVRNELYGQAIDVLQQAIERSPERMDLRVLLAQTLWDGNQKLEAGEKALDVLETLPDCLVANRIMTELWLGEKRPSDAQRFLTHIEGVEPYLALELAKGQVSDADLTIEELDYTRLAQQELAMASPDWLQDLGDLGDQAMEDEPSFHELPADPTQQRPDDDWLQTLQDASAEQTVNLTKDQLLAAKKAAAERAQATGANDEEDWLSEMEETSKKPTSSLDGLFDDIPSSTSGTAGFTDFLIHRADRTPHPICRGKRRS
jgi:tetratricopeptide (TPR) repeat protein